MADLISQLIAHLRGMWRFRWPALIVAWLVAMAGWYWVYTLPNQFESSTQVYVDTDSALRPLLKGLSTENNVMNQVELMTRALLSRKNLADVAQKTDLDLRAQTERERDKLIERLRAAIEISQRGTNIYTITFRDYDPVKTRDVVQSLLGSFVSDTLRDSREDSANALRFLDEQIREYEKRLAEDEARLADFKKRNVGMMPDSTGSYYERLESATAMKSALSKQVSLRRRARAELIDQLEGEEPTFGIMQQTTSSGMPSNTQYDSQIQALESNLAQMQLTLTDKHPDVIGTKAKLENLKAQRDEELASRRAATADVASFNPLDINPVYQSIKVNLSQTEVELVELRERLKQQTRLVAELKRAVDTVPEVEAQLARLNRDYDVTKKRYEVLLERRETARMGDMAEQSQDDVQFRVIDAPSLPLDPIGPNRFVFLLITLLAGLGAGAAFAFFMDQLKPVYITRKDLRARTGLPVLGAVGVVLMPQQKMVMRFQTAIFAIGLLGLALAFGLAIAFEERFVQLLSSYSIAGG